MGNSFITSFTEETQDRLNKSMLECSMLFSLNRNPSLEERRKDMFLQCVFSIIYSESREWTEKEVQNVFREKFGKEYDSATIKNAMQKLLRERWLIVKGNGVVPHEKIAEEMKKEDIKVLKQTNAFFDDLIREVENTLEVPLNNAERERMRGNIKNAFNLYIRMYGFESFVNNGEMAKSNGIDEVDDEDIIKAAINGLDEEKGEVLIGVLSDLMEHPTPEQATTMKLWVKIYLGTQVMRLDPQLSELEMKNLKDKKFILDTDFLLYCLVSNPKQSKSYQRLLKILRKAGCQLIIPEDVVMEVIKHAQCAEYNYKHFKKMLKAVKREVIEQKANNVFVKDFCLYDLEAKHHQTLKQYLENNFLSKEEPLEFMKQVIRDQLRIEPCIGENLEIHHDYMEYQEELTRKISWRTKNADNDKWRTDDEVQALSETDAKLYLSVLSLNKDIQTDITGSMLRAKAYLVTGTTKSVKSAQEMKLYRNFVTRPELLINLMAEIGEFDYDKHGFVNLFENPFLAHILDSNWAMIRNLSETGVNMHDKSITKLKKDLGEVYHKYLTNDADVEVIETTPNFDVVKIKQARNFFEFAEEVNKLGYELIPEIQGMVDEYKEQTKRRTTAEEKQRFAERLLAKKVHGYKEYIQKIEPRKNRNNLGYKKKK